MITINHINLPQTALEFYSQINEDTRESYHNISDRIISKLSDGTTFTPAQRRYLNSLNDTDSLKNLIIGTPENLLEKINKLDNDLFYDNARGKATEFGEIVLEIFGYDRFRKNKKSRWLSEKLGVKACLYCNMQFTVSSKKKVYYNFDHFFPKSKYPYLSLSFYNLIPVCDNCNRLKSDQDVDLTADFHPYTSPPVNTLKIFRITNESLIRYTIDFKDEKQLKIETNPNADQRIKGIVENFNINDRILAHSDIAAELVWKSMIYTEDYKRELNLLLEQSGIDKGELDRLILGNYPNTNEFHKRPLGKFTYDLAKDLKLL